LNPGRFLSFSLVYVDGATQTTWDQQTAISVYINRGPQGGSFDVSPSVGQSIVDVFHFKTHQWETDELPLYFSYHYTSVDDESPLWYPLQMESEFTQAFVRLSHFGDSAAVYKGRVAVVDGVSAMAEVTQNVSVQPSNVNLALDVSMFRLSGDVRSKMHVVYSTMPNNANLHYSNARLQQLNAQSCRTSAIDCDALHRHSCGIATGTCGECLDGYTAYAAGNTAECFAASIAVNAAVDIKKCANDCSGNGNCHFVESTTNTSLSHCTLDSFACRALCICSVGYAGDACQFSTASVQEQMASRVELAAVYNQMLVSSVYDDALSVDVWSGLVLSLGEGLMRSGVNNATFSAQLATLSNYLVLKGKSVGVLDTQKVTALAALADASQPRRFFSSLDIAFLETTVAGQHAVHHLSESKIAAYATGYDTAAIPLELTVASTSGVVVTEVSIVSAASNKTTGASVGLSLQAFADRLVSNVANVTSVPVRVVVKDAEKCDRVGGCSLTVSIRNTHAMSYATPVVDSVTVACGRGMATPSVAVCPTASKQVVCPPNFIGNVTFNCPHSQWIPSCNILHDFVGTGAMCDLVSFDDLSTHCECPVGSSFVSGTSGQRRLRVDEAGTSSLLEMEGSSFIYHDLVVSVSEQHFGMVYAANNSVQHHVKGLFPEFDLVIKTIVLIDSIPYKMLSTEGWPTLNATMVAVLPELLKHVMEPLNFTTFTAKFDAMSLVGDIPTNGDQFGSVSVSFDSFIRADDHCSVDEVFILFENALNGSVYLTGTLSLALQAVAVDDVFVMGNATVAWEHSRLYSFATVNTKSMFCITGIDDVHLVNGTVPSTRASIASSSSQSMGDMKATAVDGPQSAQQGRRQWTRSYVFYMVLGVIAFVIASVWYAIYSNRDRAVKVNLPVSAFAPLAIKKQLPPEQRP
jgi:hypothetical protein